MATGSPPVVRTAVVTPPASRPALPRPATRPAREVARRVPRPQSLAVGAREGEGGIGPTDLGQIVVADEVVAKLAARAAVEIDGVGSAASRLLGRELSGRPLDKLGLKSSELGAFPSCSAQVDGHLAFVDLTISVRYPSSVRQTAAAVRDHVMRTVGVMAGVQVVEVDIKVPALVRDLPRRSRVS